MKLEKKQIKKLIDTLTEIHDNLKEDEIYVFKGDAFSIKEDFVLPKKYSVKAITSENAKIMYPYINKKYGHGWDTKVPAHYNIYLHINTCIQHARDSSRTSRNLMDDGSYILISPEQYIKYVIEKDK
jgi:hypothetical protein